MTTTKIGYLTIFNIYEDSLSVVFPNAIDKENNIEANRPFVFPPNKAYELQMTVPDGKKASSEMFIAVVTQENIPFPNLEKLEFTNNTLRLRMEQLNVYAKWLKDSSAETICRSNTCNCSVIINPGRTTMRFISFLIIFTTSFLYSQISNVRQTTENGRIIITYNLIGYIGGIYNIKVAATNEDGKTIEPRGIVGDIHEVKIGNERSIWWETSIDGVTQLGWKIS